MTNRGGVGKGTQGGRKRWTDRDTEGSKGKGERVKRERGMERERESEREREGSKSLHQ